MNSNTPSEMIISSRLSKTKSIVGTIEAIVICTILFFLLKHYLPGNNYVEYVKKGHPNMYPNITYEQAFNSFFTSPKWAIDTTSTDTIVLFSGRAESRGNQVTYEYRFKINIDERTFDIISVKSDGIEQTGLNLILLINTPFKYFQDR